MENNNKQNFSRPYSKNSQTADLKRKTDLQASKSAFPRAGRRRDQQLPTTTRSEQERNSKQQQQQQATKQQRPYVEKRPRLRGGASYHAERSQTSAGSNTPVSTSSAGLVDSTCIDYDFFDVEDDLHERYKGRESRTCGSKRNNLNHLLNFRYVFHERADFLSGSSSAGTRGIAKGSNNTGGGGGPSRHQQPHKYNKEQFLQANFQFVIKSNVKPHLITSPDSIVDWSLIEQINIQTTEEPKCPICLYPPVAAKLTRCGHAYCWPCILHYLALNDKSWRKCPICYEAVHVTDLKSTAILQQSALNVGDAVSFQLLRRKKGSFFVEKFMGSHGAAAAAAVERYPLYAGSSDMKAFSKFLLAKRSDILSIIERERAELLADDDTTCPEYVFVQQALNLLNERREKLGDIHQASTSADVGDDDDVGDYEVSDGCIDHELINLKIDENLDLNEQSMCAAHNDAASLASSDDIKSAADSSNDLHTQQQQKYYYFYQSMDGQNIFLHPLNVKMLQACFGALEFAPLTIDARIIQKECHTMDKNLRRKFTCLGHLPLTCQFFIVEVDLKPPFIDAQTLKLFKGDIKQRQQDRERREREEKKRERKIAAINDRQMGKLAVELANINLSSTQEFPACGFDFELLPPSTANLNSSNASMPAVELATKKANKSALATAENFTGPSSPPGPSYSSIITSNESGAVSNICLFPELSLGTKQNKNKNNHHTYDAISKSQNNKGGQNRFKAAMPTNEMIESDFGESPKRIGTTFGDVMDQAIARRTEHAGAEAHLSPSTTTPTNCNNGANANGVSGGGGGGKKQKREKKKMVPLFSTNSGGAYNLN